MLAIRLFLFYVLSMPLQPTRELPSPGYWSHRSGDEHSEKHQGDPIEVNAERISRGLAAISNLYEIMSSGGLHVVRRYDQEDPNSIKEIVGYSVVDRGCSDSEEFRVVDLWAHEDHRGKSLASYSLTETCFPQRLAGFRAMPGFIPLTYGSAKILVCDTVTIPFINFHHKINYARLGENEFDKYMTTPVPPKLTVLREIDEGDTINRQLIREGSVAWEESIESKSTSTGTLGLSWALEKLIQET